MRKRYQKQDQKRALYHRQGGLCYYCGRFMRFMKWLSQYGRQPIDLATIEHLDSRYSADRGKRAGEFRRVLACYECNQAKIRADRQSLTSEQREFFLLPRASRPCAPSNVSARSAAVPQGPRGLQSSEMLAGESPRRILVEPPPGCQV